MFRFIGFGLEEEEEIIVREEEDFEEEQVHEEVTQICCTRTMIGKRRPYQQIWKSPM